MLSIDWDFFVPEKLEWDFGHIENNFFLEIVWLYRVKQFEAMGLNYLEEIKTTGEENVFWDKIRRVINFKSGLQTFITESHTIAYYFAKELGVNKVINIDAHSDLGYHHCDNIECDNWLLYLYKNGVIDDFLVVYPEHSIEYKDGASAWVEYRKKITSYKNFTQRKNKIDVDTLFICRSGCWTPPWLDDDFYDFVIRSGLVNKYSVDVKKRFFHKRGQVLR